MYTALAPHRDPFLRTGFLIGSAVGIEEGKRGGTL